MISSSFPRFTIILTSDILIKKNNNKENCSVTHHGKRREQKVHEQSFGYDSLSDKRHIGKETDSYFNPKNMFGSPYQQNHLLFPLQ